MVETPEDPKTTENKEESPEEKEWPSSDLFAGAKEVIIIHEGERYRLRITRRGKLILHK